MLVDMGLKEGLDRLAGTLHASFVGTEGIRRNLTRGEARERDVAAALRPHIPSRFELLSGEVVNTANERSAPQDILIIDTWSGAPFLTSGGLGIYPIETVFASLQIKSSVGPREIREAVTNLASVKSLQDGLPRTVGVLTDAGLALANTGRKPFTAALGFRSIGDSLAKRIA